MTGSTRRVPPKNNLQAIKKDTRNENKNTTNKKLSRLATTIPVNLRTLFNWRFKKLAKCTISSLRKTRLGRATLRKFRQQIRLKK